ncbi:MAG: ABC transporter permease [Spirochaetales bacterium]|nr:ABC transporter permease [Spirochaetales bacterium]
MNLCINNVNQRKKSLFVISFCLFILIVLFLICFFLPDRVLLSDLTNTRMVPSIKHVMGTDWLGRDMFARILKGFLRSFFIGFLSAGLSAAIAAISGVLAALSGKMVDKIITGLIDLVLALPHMVLLILLSFAMGGCSLGVIIAVAFTHWPSLTRVVRAEIIQLKESEYIRVSQKLGRGKAWITLHHILPHISSQIAVGVILMFPHAILHAAGLAFLGFGLNPSEPSIGVLLREAMMHLSTGYWWIAVFPGLMLLILVLLFDAIGKNLKRILDPKTAQE